ncbi:cellulase family glycosylhydrolase [Endomicrobium sp. AH-315-J14]|nr:cellulase family glycosylhydrolase [Endomicrobium sp. AH-315-J14]
MRRWACGLSMFFVLSGCSDPETAAPVQYDLPEAPRCSIDAPKTGTLKAEGTRLVDEHGRTVLLRGVNAGGRSKFAPYMPFEFDEQSFASAVDTYAARARSYGFTALRVPFTWAAMEPEEGKDDEVFLKRYDALLDAAWKHGMWTIVDFHQDIYAESLCGDGFPDWTLEDPGEPHHDCPGWFTKYAGDDDVKAGFDALWTDETGVRTGLGAMWDRMVDRHAERAGVIGYEIINEPHGGSMKHAVWEETVLSPFYSEMIARMQERDADALVFFDASGLAATQPGTDMTRPEGDNIVFAPHFYDPGALFGWGVNEDVMTPLSIWAEVGKEWDLPVLLGEFGIVADHEDAEAHAGRQFDALDALGMHGTWWEYSASDELWNSENLSLIKGDGSDNGPMHRGIVRPVMRALSGTMSNLSWDAATARWLIEFDAEPDGISEIVMPSRLYGEGVRIGAEGACVEVVGDRLLVKAEGETVRLSVDRL